MAAALQQAPRMVKRCGIWLVMAALVGFARAAQARFTIDLGTPIGFANDVHVTGTDAELVQLPSVGLMLRGGAAGDHFEAGASLTTSWAPFSPAASAFGLYAGPSISSNRRRLSLLGEIGIQEHTGLGNEYSGFVQSPDVTLPYVGAAVAFWWSPRGQERSALWLGILTEARFDIGHQSAQANVTPSCVNVLACAIAGAEPQPFTQTYDVGGHAIYLSFVIRLSPAVPSRHTRDDL